MIEPTSNFYIEQASLLAKLAGMELSRPHADVGKGETYLKEALEAIKKARETNNWEL